MSDLPKPDHARNMRLIGYPDQGVRPDGVQVTVRRGHAYIGHMFSQGNAKDMFATPNSPMRKPTTKASSANGG